MRGLRWRAPWVTVVALAGGQLRYGVHALSVHTGGVHAASPALAGLVGAALVAALAVIALVRLLASPSALRVTAPPVLVAAAAAAGACAVIRPLPRRGWRGGRAPPWSAIPA